MPSALGGKSGLPPWKGTYVGSCKPPALAAPAGLAAGAAAPPAAALGLADPLAGTEVAPAGACAAEPQASNRGSAAATAAVSAPRYSRPRRVSRDASVSAPNRTSRIESPPCAPVLSLSRAAVAPRRAHPLDGRAVRRPRTRRGEYH